MTGAGIAGGGHDPRGLVGPRKAITAGAAGSAGAPRRGLIGAQRRLRRGRTGRGRLSLDWPLPSDWPPARSLLQSAAGSAQRDTDGVGAGPLATGCSTDACCDGSATGVTAGSGGCDLRRNDDDAQIGYLDPSILPGEAEARKPTLATEDQAQ